MSSPLRRALERAKARFPAPYAAARTALSLGQWYAARIFRRGAADTPFDDAFWDRAEVGDWEGFARAILRHAPARSVLDVGCGGGRLLEAMRAVDPTLRLKGIDASGPALERARRRGLDVGEVDFVAARMSDVDALAMRLGEFDLVVCLEVAEHIPAWHSGKLMRLLGRYDRVVFSAAHPLQGGTLHVNERPAAHWTRRFGRMGLAPSEVDEELRREVKELDLPWWYAANIHAFGRGAPNKNA